MREHHVAGDRKSRSTSSSRIGSAYAFVEPGNVEVPQCTTSGIPASWHSAYAGYIDAVVGREAGVHRVDLAGDRAEVELAGQLLLDRVVQVRVDVRDQPDPVGVRGQREQVLDRLDPGHLGAVLGEQQRDVHALAGQVRVEPGRVDGAVGVVDRVEQPAVAEVLGPGPPGRLERRQPGRVQVHVDQRAAVQHQVVVSAAAASAGGSGSISTVAAIARSSTRRILPVAVVG